MLSIVFEPRAWKWIVCKALGRRWPGVYWSRLGAVRLREAARPVLPGPEWVLLRSRLGGVCGTDMGMVMMKHHPGSLLRTWLADEVALGHENVAEVVEAGRDVTGWRVGQRVTADSSLGCSARGIRPVCRSCGAGLFCLCENFDRGAIGRAVMLGVTAFAGGSWSEYFVAHQSQLHALPDSLADEEAVLVDPVACAVHGVLRCWPGTADRVAVLGGGILALATIAGLRALGWTGPIDALVRSESTGERARQAGASRAVVMGRSGRVVERLAPVAAALGERVVRGRYGTGFLPAGYDVVYDAVGTGVSVSDAAKLTRARGTVALVGTPQIVLAELTPLWFREQRLVGCYGRQMEADGTGYRHTYEMVLDLIARGKLSLSAWRAEVHPARQWQVALAAAAGLRAHRPVKTAIDFRGL